MKASEEAEQALLAFQKADQDMANSRLQIEKVTCCIKAMIYNGYYTCILVFTTILHNAK